MPGEVTDSSLLQEEYKPEVQLLQKKDEQLETSSYLFAALV